MITVDMFKSHFSRDFPYIPTWTEGKIYFTDDVVYVEPNFYQSLIDNNTSEVTDTTAWSPIKESTDSYLQDSDIQKAIYEATLAINTDLWEDNQTDDYIGDLNLVMLYLTAYYLVVDINNSSAGLSSKAYSSFVASKSVGNVSESYAIPAWLATNPMYSLYMSNGYGQKYLTFLIPAVSGFFYVAPGGTTYD